jgi:nucleoside-diphosphate-sugar epimerase
LITGATGFLGGKLLQSLENASVVGRTKPNIVHGMFYLSNLDADSDFSECLDNIECIIHCAARVHVMNDNAEDPLEAFREVNTYGTLNLAKQAAEAGVKRFIFISSIKVNGESTGLGKLFTGFDCRKPQDPYGQSKSEAEEGLLTLAKQTGMEVVIIRPPLVYGPGVKANFASLMNLVSKGFPLPFGAIRSNKRSLVSLGNLVDLIITCIDHPKAANQVFLVSDDQDLSTAELIQYMAKGLGSSGRMLPVPVWCYHLAGKLLRKEDVVNRLIGSLQVDISHTKKTLAWTPPQSLESAFKETAQAFLYNKEHNK